MSVSDHNSKFLPESTSNQNLERESYIALERICGRGPRVLRMTVHRIVVHRRPRRWSDFPRTVLEGKGDPTTIPRDLHGVCWMSTSFSTSCKKLANHCVSNTRLHTMGRMQRISGTS